MPTHTHAALFAAVALVAAAAGSGARAAATALNDTGLTQCVDRHGTWSSDCARSRQDAGDGRDAHDADPGDGLAGFSFRKVCRSGEFAGEGNCPADPALGSGPDDWGCTHDNVTRLTWEAKTADGGLHDGQARFSNRGARARDAPLDAAWFAHAVNGEALCGSTGWRLPTVAELQSIVDYGMGAPGSSAPYVDPAYFPNTQALQAWTGTAWAADAKRAWTVDFYVGGLGTDRRGWGFPVRLVHGADAQAHRPRFVPSADGNEVTDTLTGLVWRRCAAGQHWDPIDQRCDGILIQFDWPQALDYAQANRQGGWRVPNVKELASIVDQATHHPAADRQAFPDMPTHLPFFSSTPKSQDGMVYVHGIEFATGSLLAGQDPTWLLRLVRRGRE